MSNVTYKISPGSNNGITLLLGDKLHRDCQRLYN